MSLILNFIFNEFLSDLLSGLAYASLWCSEFASFKGKSNFYLELCMRAHLARPFVIPSVDLNALASLDPFWRITRHVIIYMLIYMLYCIGRAKCLPFFLLPLFAFMKLSEHSTVRFDVPCRVPKSPWNGCPWTGVWGHSHKTIHTALWDTTVVLNWGENWETAMTQGLMA